MARGFGQMIDRVPAALNTILFPLLTKISDLDEASRLTARAFRLILVLMTVIGVVAVVAIYPAVYLMYGSAFLPLVAPFVILIPGIILSGATAPIMQFLMSIDRAELGISLPIMPLALQIGLALLLIPLWGPEGAAIAYSTALTTLSFINIWMFLRLSKRTFWADLMIQPSDLSYLLKLSMTEAGKLMRLANITRA
jgi:O-antigen/teichoic acid export membrane protein